jgi:hypothetical protein
MNHDERVSVSGNGDKMHHLDRVINEPHMSKRRTYTRKHAMY